MRARFVLAAVLIGALLAGLVGAGSAAAAPSPEEIEAQIDKKWEQLEPVIEQYNRIHAKLQANQKKSAALQKKMGPLSLKADLAMNRIGVLAAQQYKVGPGADFNALLMANSTGELGAQLAMLDVLARGEKAAVADVIAVRDKYNAEKRQLDALIVEQKKQDVQLSAQRKQINAEIKKLEDSLPPTIVRVEGCPRVSTVTSQEAIAVKTACAQVGDPYVWGADGPNSFDCSGLTQYAWKAAGVSLTHHTGDQWGEGRSVSNPRAGDLVFFYSDLPHVGLYLGNGKMVHAPRAGKPVQVSSTSTMPIAGYRRVI